MWLPNPLLKKIQELKHCGVDFPRVPGTHIGRGFADLGVEQFLLISDKGMVSLFNGAKSELPTEHEKFFFWIPSVDEIIQKILAAGWTVLSLEHKDSRSWNLSLRSNEGMSLELSHRDFYELWIDAFLAVKKK